MINGIKWQTRPMCAEGWTLSDDELSCVKIDTESATQVVGDSRLVQHYGNTAYSGWGTVIYKPNGVNSDGTWPLGDFSLYPNIYTTTPQSNYINATAIYYETGIWRNSVPNTTDGRLNLTGLWLQGNQAYIGTLGFGREIDIPHDGFYYMGVGTDDNSTISIDNVDVLIQNTTLMATAPYLNDTGGSVSFYYRYWSLYPFYLTKGKHLIKVTTTSSVGLGILGFEIYDATETQSINCTTTTNLNQYIIQCVEVRVESSYLMAAQHVEAE